MTKNKIKPLLIAGVLCVVLAIGCIVGNLLIGKSKVSTSIVSSDEEIASILQSHATPSGIVYGRSDGHVVAIDSEGKTIFDTECSNDGSSISFLTEAGENIFAADTQRRIFIINTSGEIIKTFKSPGNFVNALYVDGKYYIAMSKDNADLRIRCYDEDFNFLKGGIMSLYNADMDEMEDANIAVYGMFADKNGDNLYIVNDLAQIFVLPTDFKCLTDDKEEFLASGFKEFRLERSLSSVAIDEDEQRLLITTLDNKLRTFDLTTHELGETPITFKEKVCKITYDSLNKRIYVAYELFSTVTVCDLENMKVLSSFKNEFNPKFAEVSADGENYFTLFMSDSNKYLKQTGIEALNKELKLKPIAVILLVVGIILAVLGLALVICAIAESKQKSVIKVLQKGGKEVLKHKFIYILLLPSIALLFVFCYYPSISSLIMAFFDYRYGYPVIFNGFDNFRVLALNPTFKEAFINMFVFLGADLLIGIIPPIVFAWCLAVMRSKSYSSAARMLLFLPGVIPGVAGILIWKNGIYGASGVLNTIIKACGGNPIAFLGDNNWSVFSLIMMGFPFVGSYLIFYGSMVNIPSAYYEVAELEGCGVIKRIIMIDIPFVSPQIKYVFVMSFIGSIQNVGRVMMTTQGAAGTQIPINIMYNYLTDNNYGVAAAMALILFGMLMIATILNLKIRTADTDV